MRITVVMEIMMGVRMRVFIDCNNPVDSNCGIIMFSRYYTEARQC